jgi:outer membrane protein OmpA-like peptidoglycan-associated protein
MHKLTSGGEQRKGIGMRQTFVLGALLLLSTGAVAGAPAAPLDTARDAAGRPLGEVTVPPSQTGTNRDLPGLRDIHFAFDRADLRLEDRQVLASNAEWLKAHPDVNITIEGDADERGEIIYNLVLSDHRALATRDALRAHLLGNSDRAHRFCHWLG